MYTRTHMRTPGRGGLECRCWPDVRRVWTSRVAGRLPPLPWLFIQLVREGPSVRPTLPCCCCCFLAALHGRQARGD